MIDSIVSSKAAMLEDPMWEDRPRAGRGKGIGRGIGDGVGDGTGGRPRRWEIEFPEGNTLEMYARQLDYFGIELGILLPDGKVVYAFHFTRPKPDSRTGSAEAEKRYYLTWRRGRDRLIAADRELLARAGIPAEGKIIIKFLPPKVEAELAALEKQYADQRGEKRIRKTVFRIRPEGQGYAFLVSEQTYE